MKQHALIVDDEEAYRIFLREIFERIGFTVLTAENGKRALEQIEGVDLSVVVTDMVMPDMDGAEFIARLRMKNATVPIIAITGYMNGHASLQAVNDYLVSGVIYKPFAAKEIRNVVEQVVPK
jgi:CheY-like chemotaxis protein